MYCIYIYICEYIYIYIFVTYIISIKILYTVYRAKTYKPPLTWVGATRFERVILGCPPVGRAVAWVLIDGGLPAHTKKSIAANDQVLKVEVQRIR